MYHVLSMCISHCCHEVTRLCMCMWWLLYLSVCVGCLCILLSVPPLLFSRGVRDRLLESSISRWSWWFVFVLLTCGGRLFVCSSFNCNRQVSFQIRILYTKYHLFKHLHIGWLPPVTLGNTIFLLVLPFSEQEVHCFWTELQETCYQFLVWECILKHFLHINRNRTALTWEHITHLLKLCLKTMCLKFREKYHQQMTVLPLAP